MTDLRTLLGIGLIVAGFLLPNGSGGILPTPGPTDREQIAVFYDSLAMGVENDGAKAGEKFYADTADFRRAHVDALRLWRDVRKVGTVPGLGEGVDKVLADMIGLEVQPMTDEVRSKVIAACREVARRLRDGEL